jgi:hypothetical protein
MTGAASVSTILGAYTYRLRAANSGGAEVSQELTVNVEMMPGPIPTDEPLPPAPEPDPPDAGSRT